MHNNYPAVNPTKNTYLWESLQHILKVPATGKGLRHHVLSIYPRPHTFRRWKVPGCSPWCHKSSLEQKTTMHLYITRKVEAGAPLFLLNKAYFGEGKQFFQCITQPPSSKLTEMWVDPHLVARIISHFTGRDHKWDRGPAELWHCGLQHQSTTIDNSLPFAFYLVHIWLQV